MFNNRSTIDIVVILMTLTIGSVLLLSVVSLAIGRFIYPTMDISRGAEAVTNITTTIVGALVGFIGGRATGRMEANGGNAK